MIYLDYEQFKDRYLETQKKYDEILAEKEELFAMTQPKAIRFDKERVSGGDPVNSFEQYVIRKEKQRIDERLLEAKSLLDDRERLLKLKEKQLRESKDISDKVFLLRFIEHKRVYLVAKMVNYSEPQVYRILDGIRKRIKERK